MLFRIAVFSCAMLICNYGEFSFGNPKFDSRKIHQIWQQACELTKIVGKLNNVLHSVLRQLQSEIDRVQYRLDWIYNTVVRYIYLDIVEERVANCIRLVKECLQQYSGSNSHTFQHAVQTAFTGERGRPGLQLEKKIND